MKRNNQIYRTFGTVLFLIISEPLDQSGNQRETLDSQDEYLSATIEPEKSCIDSDRKLKDRISIEVTEKDLDANIIACLIEPQTYERAVTCYDPTKLKKGIID